jgi:hypothetical protein
VFKKNKNIFLSHSQNKKNIKKQFLVFLDFSIFPIARLMAISCFCQLYGHKPCLLMPQLLEQDAETKLESLGSCQDLPAAVKAQWAILNSLPEQPANQSSPLKCCSAGTPTQ